MYTYIHWEGVERKPTTPEEDRKLLVVGDFQQGYRPSRIQPGMKVTRRIASHPAGARLFEIPTSIFWPVYPRDGRGGEHRGAKRTHRSVIRVSESGETVRGRRWIKFREFTVCKNEKHKKKKKKTDSYQGLGVTSILYPRFCGR